MSLNDLLSTPQTTRFAPSPTGLLHLGHAYAAIVAHDLARTSGGRFYLRIEDIDQTRSRRAFEQAIYEDLAWLGLSWDEPVRRQSEHVQTYRQFLDMLSETGLIYPCFCTRRDIEHEIAQIARAPHDIANGPEGPLYPGTCRDLTERQIHRHLSTGREPAGRLNIKAVLDRFSCGLAQLSFFEWGAGHHGEHGEIAVDPALFGDIVLSRRDIGVSYHLAVVVDDHMQGVTLVSRGEDLFPATHIQRVLQFVFRFDRPAYFHHQLVRDAAGRRLAKRDKDLTIKSLRESGVSPDHIRRRLGLPIV